MPEISIHILGVAGTFMANLAVLAKQLGFSVTGSDEHVYPPMSTLLEQEHIEYITNYNLNDNKLYLDNADCIIIGNSLSRSNSCVEYILDNKLKFKSGPAWLYENLLCDKWVLAVSGTHGKTTTTSLLATILDSNDYAPGFLIGGRANNFTEYARTNDSDYFVIEADEYDTAFFDKRPKFLHYFPNTLIINNVEFDHADIYSDLASIEHQFGYLLRTVSQRYGCVIAPYELYAKLESPSEITKKSGSKKSSLNLSTKYFLVYEDQKSFDSDPLSKVDILCAVLIKPDGSEFDCYINKKHMGTAKWECLGVHNVSNALAAILAANHVGVNIPDAINSLSNFKGVARRLDKKAEFKSANIMIYDDFAHHPTAIKTTLQGLKNRYAGYQLILVLDFSSYTMQHDIYDAALLASSIDTPDIIYLHQEAHLKLNLDNIIAKLKPNQIGHNVSNTDQLIEKLSINTQPNQVIVFMTKSGFNKNINKLISNLEITYGDKLLT